MRYFFYILLVVFSALVFLDVFQQVKVFRPYDTPSPYALRHPPNRLLERFQGKQFFFVGTSFLRVLYFDFVRLALERDPTKKERYIPSYDGFELVENDKCENGVCYSKKPGKSKCNLPGRAGVDLVTCGIPHNQTMHFETYNITIHFQFKTYLSTPQHDQMIARDLRLGNYDYLILGSAEWGRNKFIKQNYMEQARNYYETILPVFNGDKIVFVYNRNYNNSTNTQYRYLTSLQNQKVHIFDTKPVVEEARRKKVFMGHGYEGKASLQILKSILLTL